jgi:hypothetical protein
MNNITELWRVQEIKNIKTQIKEKENMLKQYDNELAEISKQRKPLIKDFAILNSKYGSKSYNRVYVSNYYKRLIALKKGYFKSKEEYYRIAII